MERRGILDVYSVAVKDGIEKMWKQRYLMCRSPEGYRAAKHAMEGEKRALRVLFDAWYDKREEG